MSYDDHPEDAFDPRTGLDCQECEQGRMAVYEDDEDGSEYILRCDACGWMAHASYRAVALGDWTAAA